MTTIILDGLSEEEFRRSIEMRLRHDLAGAAIERLRGLIAPFARPGGVLPERFLTVCAADVNLYGWDSLADALRRHDRPGRPITALSIAFGWPGEEPPQPDAEGRLSPLVETSYYTDDAFPFSASSREDLLDGYSYHGCTWADDCQARDSTIALGGIDDLHGALALLETRLLSSEEPDSEEIRAGSLGACLLSVLLFQAIGERISRDGLPRPLCVMAGSNGVYPYFDAPVVGIPEDVRKAAEAAEEEEAVDTGVPGPRYSSLLVTGIPRAKKRAVLVLEESAEEMAVRIAALRGLHHRDETPDTTDSDQPPPREAEAAIAPMPDGPLLTKKSPGQSWDFREMLGPRDALDALQDSSAPLPPDPVSPPLLDERPPVPDLPFEIVGDGEPEQPVGEPHDDTPDPPLAELLPPFSAEPVAMEPSPRPRFPSQTPVGPGFSLLEPAIQDRLDSLLAPRLPALRPAEPEPEAPAVRPGPVETADTVTEALPDLGPVWPLGIGWLEDLESESEPGGGDPGCDERSASRPGLWRRVLGWMGLRR